MTALRIIRANHSFFHLAQLIPFEFGGGSKPNGQIAMSAIVRIPQHPRWLGAEPDPRDLLEALPGPTDEAHSEAAKAVKIIVTLILTLWSLNKI